MNRLFSDLFEPFFVKMAKLHYKTRSGARLNEEDNKMIECTSCLIPIFNLMMTDQKISLENIREFANETNIPQNITNSIPEPPKSTSCPQLVTVQEEPEDIDLEGDAQVAEITKRNLEILEKIQMNRWVPIEECPDSDSEESELETIDFMKYESPFTHSENNSESLQFVDSESSHDDNIAQLFW